MKAADLPKGSIVASANNPLNVYVKEAADQSRPWLVTGDRRNFDNSLVDLALAHGARLLRRGYGEECQ